VSIRLVAPTGRQPELLLMLSAILAPTRVEPGCVQARIYVDADNTCALTLVQEWESQRELDRYLASEACKVVLAALESSLLAPEVRFDTIASRAGLEVIEIARRSTVRGPRLL
jgi:quinol monooxygenase YgiN